MSGKLKKRLFISWFLILAVVAVSAVIYFNRTVYNPENAVGNTAGNLNNNGMFCEYNGKIYFANPYDKNCLYSMNLDCSGIRKLNSDSVSSINVYGKYIYYIRNNYSAETAAAIFRGNLLGVIRTDLNGQKLKSLYDSAAGVITLYGNHVYYQHYSNEDALSFYKVKINGKENVRITDEDWYPASIYNGELYYTNTNGDHAIYAYNLTSGHSRLVLDANAYMVDMQGNYLYYIDLADKYSLVRVNTQTLEREILVDGRNGKCISYNIWGNSLFYHVEGDSPALYRMNTDGTNVEFIKYGNITNISCTSTYTFFEMYGTSTLYRVPTSGAANVELVTIQ